jgi:intracellular septation protein A
MRNFLHAARPLANDLFSSIVFAALIAMKTDPMIATGVAIAIGIGHVLFMWATKRKVAALQWASLGLVLVFGTASLFLHDARFLMAKPTVIYAIIAVVMLKRGWMLRYMPPIAGKHGEGPMIVFGYIWAGLMVVTGAANLITAIYFPVFWPAFMAVFPMASKLTLFAVHYLTVQAIVKPKVIAEQRAQAAASA